MIIGSILVLILLTLLFGAAAVRGAISSGCGLALLCVVLVLLMSALSKVTAEQWAWTIGVMLAGGAAAWAGWYWLGADERRRAKRLREIDNEQAKHSKELQEQTKLDALRAHRDHCRSIRAMSLMAVFYELDDVATDSQKEEAFEHSRWNRIEELEVLVREVCNASGATLRFENGKYSTSRFPS